MNKQRLASLAVVFLLACAPSRAETVAAVAVWRLTPLKPIVPAGEIRRVEAVVPDVSEGADLEALFPNSTPRVVIYPMLRFPTQGTWVTLDLDKGKHHVAGVIEPAEHGRRVVRVRVELEGGVVVPPLAVDVGSEWLTHSLSVWSPEPNVTYAIGIRVIDTEAAAAK